MTMIIAIVIVFLALIASFTLIILGIIVMSKQPPVYFFRLKDLTLRRNKGRKRDELWRHRDLYDNLLRKTLGDAATVARLVEMERKKLPYADTRTLMQNAIDRWEKDNRA